MKCSDLSAMRTSTVLILCFVICLSSLVKSQSLNVTSNPFSKRTLAICNLVNTDSVSLEIMNVNGQVITTVFSNSLMLPGNYQDSIRLDNYPDGVYFLSLKLKQGGSKALKLVKSGTVGIKGTGSDNGIKIYPNPFACLLNIELVITGIEEQKLTIHNTLGQTVYQLNSPLSKQELDLSYLPNGIYFLKAQSQLRQAFFKIVKE